MFALLFALLWFQQPVPAAGVVIGTLRDAEGSPATGVRVAAVAASENGTDPFTLVSIDETNAEGRFVLSNIPPGRYYVIAGRLDAPTIYPGTEDMSNGKTVSVQAASTVTGIDFTLQDSSRRPTTNPPSLRRPVQVRVSIQIVVEGDERATLLASSPQARLLLANQSGGANLEANLSATDIAIPVTDPVTEYRVQVTGLPQGYVVKSIRTNGADFTNTPLKASPVLLVGNATPVRVVTFGGPGALQQAVDRAMERTMGPRGFSVVIGRQ